MHAYYFTTKRKRQTYWDIKSNPCFDMRHFVAAKLERFCTEHRYFMTQRRIDHTPREEMIDRGQMSERGQKLSGIFA